MASPTPPRGSPVEYTTQQIPGTVYENLDQDIIHITADRARLYLSEWSRKIEAQGSWIAPFSLAATILLALLTADFRDKFGIPKDYWSSAFSLGLIANIIWLGRTVIRRKKNPPETVEQMIKKFKKVPEAEG